MEDMAQRRKEGVQKHSHVIAKNLENKGNL